MNSTDIMALRILTAASRVTRFTGLFFIALSACDRTACALTIVVPQEFATVEATDNTNAPFGRGPGRGRYQQVFDGSEFAPLTGPTLMTEIRLRPDAQFGESFSFTTGSLEIFLSTTALGPDELSDSFANNIGPDVTLIHNGPLQISSNNIGGASGPKDFDVVIKLQTPFLYDPSAGNLLFDAIYPEGNGGPFGRPIFDGQRVQGDSISCVIGDTETADGMIHVDTGGFLAAFTFVPEPAGKWLISIAATTVWLRSRASQHWTPEPK